MTRAGAAAGAVPKFNAGRDLGDAVRAGAVKSATAPNTLNRPGGPNQAAGYLLSTQDSAWPNQATDKPLHAWSLGLVWLISRIFLVNE